MPDNQHPDTPDSQPALNGPEGYKLSSNAAWLQYTAPDYKRADFTGWKVQLSVSPEDHAKAWDLIAEHMPEYGIKAAKVARPSFAAEISSLMSGQSGKMIVIYDTGLADWDKRLLEIEALFQKNGIRPGVAVKDNRPITGSRYSFYIHDDGDKLGGYRPAVSRRTFPKNQRHNLGGHPDPFKAIDVALVYGETSTPLERVIQEKLREGQVSVPMKGTTFFSGDIEGLQEMQNLFEALDPKVRTSLGVTGPGTGFLRVMPASNARVNEMIVAARIKNEQSGDSLPAMSR